MASKRKITATAPDGLTVESDGLGPKRVVGAIRICAHPRWDGTPTTGWGGWNGHGEKWLVTVHKSLEHAITGPGQAAEWSRWERWAIAIDENDQPVGDWYPASK